MDQRAHDMAIGVKVEGLFKRIRALEQPDDGNKVPDNENMVKLRRVVQNLREIALPCLESRDPGAFYRIGILFFWTFERSTEKGEREQILQVGRTEAGIYAPWLQDAEVAHNNLCSRLPNASKLFSEIIVLLHPVSHEKTKKS